MFYSFYQASARPTSTAISMSSTERSKSLPCRPDEVQASDNCVLAFVQNDAYFNAAAAEAEAGGSNQCGEG